MLFIRILLLILLALPIHTNSFSQSYHLNKIDSMLARSFSKLIICPPSKRDSISKTIKSSIKHFLTDTATFNYSFDNTSNFISIVKSVDNKMKIYSWDEMTGEIYHNMAVFVQYKTTNGDIELQQLDTESDKLKEDYTDAIISHLYTILVNNKTYYLTIGSGTLEEGFHHTIVQIFIIEDDMLNICSNCIENRMNLIIEAPRSHKINLKYNPEKQEITHNEFIDFEDTYKPTGNRLLWQLTKGVFKIKNSLEN